jgi:hypothetical protein
MSLHVGWHLVIRVFSKGITRESHLKPTGQDLPGGGGGGISSCLVLWRGTCPCWLSPMNGDPGSTQTLTRHCGAKSQTVSQLVKSGTTPARQVSIIQSLRVIETPTDRVSAYIAPPSDNMDRTVGLH